MTPNTRRSHEDKYGIDIEEFDALIELIDDEDAKMILGQIKERGVI